MRVDFYLIAAMEVGTFAPIWRALRERGVEAEMVAVPGRDNTAAPGWFDYENALNVLETLGLPYASVPDYSCAAAITTQYSDILALYRNLRLRVMYGVSLSDTIYTHRQENCLGFDGVIAHGPYAQSKLRRWLPEERVRIAGYPKYDVLFSSGVETAKVRSELGLDSRPIILYLPTWEHRSSIDRFFPSLASLTNRFQLVVKPHHLTAQRELERMRVLENSAARVVSGNHPITELFAVADIVVADISSGAFGEAILIDRPLIGIHPHSAAPIFHVDERVYRAAPICEDPADLQDLVGRVLASDSYSEARVALRDDLCAFRDGHAADRTADVILEFVADNQRRPWRTIKREVKCLNERARKIAKRTRLSNRIRHPQRTIRNAIRRVSGL